MINFAGETIKCGDNHSHLHVSGGELQAVRTHFWGVSGNSEIVSGPGTWTLHCRCWLNDGGWPATAAGLAQLRTYLKLLRDLRGEHGEVIEQITVAGTAGTFQRFTAATFEGFQEIPFDGQNTTASPVPDVSGMLGGGWIVAGELRWTLLRDDEE